MIPQSGIDVIRLILSPIFFNKEYFKNDKYVDPHNRLTIHQVGMFYTLEIHIEYMDLLEDIHYTIAKAIYDLIFKGFIFFPFFEQLLYFIKEHLNWFVLGISEVEFYFNLIRKSVIVNEKAVENGNLNQFKENSECQYSFYSNDYRIKKQTNKKTEKVTRKIITHSRAHLYDKKNKDILDNHTKHKELNNNPFDIRLEFKLFRDNCNFLSLNNFQGNYNEVLNRYIPLLAVYYNNYIHGHIHVKGKNNKELTKVIRKSRSTGVRYRNITLKTTEPIPHWVRKKNIDYKEQVKNIILEQENVNKELPDIVKNHLQNEYLK